MPTRTQRGTLRAWRETGILGAGAAALRLRLLTAIFAFPAQTGVVRERRGFIALGELYDYSQGVVFRHEQTLSKPKSDRLNLLRATRAHFGQIFMLYSDPAQERGGGSVRERRGRGDAAGDRGDGRVRGAASGVADQRSGEDQHGGRGHG